MGKAKSFTEPRDYRGVFLYNKSQAVSNLASASYLLTYNHIVTYVKDITFILQFFG